MHQDRLYLFRLFLLPPSINPYDIMSCQRISYTISISKNGWITYELGIKQFYKVSEPYTALQITGGYRLLILDRHGSHATARFDRFYIKKIILLYIPPYSSHLLQPLDVSCFTPLKHLYGQRVDLLFVNESSRVSSGGGLTQPGGL